MKRLICMLLLLALCLPIMGCARYETAQDGQSSEEISLFATFYPIYALAELIVDDVPDVRLNCLVQPQDGCLRNYQLSDWDLALLLRSADAVIAGGRGLESFEGTLTALGESGPAVSTLMYNMVLSKAEAVNVPQDAESHWQDENPFVYMSVDGAIELCRRLAAHMATLDPKYQAQYAQNFEAAQARLEALKAEMLASAGTCSGVDVAVMNEALVYTAEMFDMNIALCWAREGGEGVEGADLESCLKALDNSGAKIVLIEKQAPAGLCAALENSGYVLAKLDTMSTRPASEGADGYFAAQLANAEAIGAACEAQKGEGIAE